MSSTSIRIVVAVILIGHGLGHALGLLPLAGVRLSTSHSAGSWLLSPLIGDAPARALGAVLWLASLSGFVAAGIAIAGLGLAPSGWTRLAGLAAVLSLVTLTLFWHGFPFLFPNKIGAIAVDLALLISVLWLRWPAALAVE
jgi:hypothetical protein